MDPIPDRIRVVKDDLGIARTTTPILFGCAFQTMPAPSKIGRRDRMLRGLELYGYEVGGVGCDVFSPVFLRLHYPVAQVSNIINDRSYLFDDLLVLRVVVEQNPIGPSHMIFAYAILDT